MKRILLTALVLGAAISASVGSLSAAEPYDEKLEFIESSGTQWIDTGIKLHWKRSAMDLNFRVLEAPATVGSGVSIAGVTGVKDNNQGGTPRRSFVMRIGQPSADKYALWPSFSGGNNNGAYRFPDNDTGDDEYKRTWNARSEWRDTEFQGVVASRMCFIVNGQKKAGYYNNYADEWSDYSFYIGVANNAGEGLFDAEGSLAKLHWYGVKLYTDGELVGDFIPVKKNGVAGFYDNVSEQFFPSQGADPWIAPTTVAWTGNGDAANLSDGDNWDGGAAPSSANEVAVIPGGMSVTGSVETVTTAFNGLGGVRLAGADSLLHMKGISATSHMFFPVSGTGVLRAEAVSSSTTYLHFRQNMQNFYGLTQITNMMTGLDQPYALGDKSRSSVDVYLDGGSQRFTLWSYGAYGKFIVRKHGQFVFLSGTPLFEYADWTFPKGYVTILGNGDANWRIRGKLTGRTDAQEGIYPYSMAHTSFEGEPKWLNLSQLRLGANKTTFGCPVHSLARAKDASGTGQEQANVRVESGKSVVFASENVFDTNCFFQVGYANNPTLGKTNLIDLDGYDQRLGTLSVWASSFDGSTVWNENLMITSAAPATLTIYGQLRTDTGATSKHVFPGRVMGEASIALNSLQSVMEEAWSWPDATVPGGIRFNCPESETYGTLSSARGTLEVMETATFPNLSGIVVSGTGVVKLSTSAVGTDNAAFDIAVRDSTARLELASGVSISCNFFEIPGGQYLSPGFYSENASEGVNACEYITGSGVVEVRNVKWSGWPAAGSVSTVTIPPGTAVTITDADIESVEALDGIATTDGVTISIETTEPLTIGAAISGPAVITANNAGKVTLAGDNSGLVAPGHFEFTAMTNGVEVANFFGLGGTDTATDVFTQSSGYLNWLTFKSVNGVFTNSAPIRLIHGGGEKNRLVMGAENAGDVLVFANDLDIDLPANGENHWHVANGVRIINGLFKLPWHVRLWQTTGATLEFLGDSEAEFGRGGDQSVLYFTGIVFGGKSVWAANGLAPDYGRNIQVVKENCLGTNCVIRSYPNGESPAHFDFCGCDQEISRLAQAGGGSLSPQLTSADPAVLHAMGPTPPSSQATVSLRYVFAGALGYWHDVEQNLTLISKSTSSGDLKVTKGSLAFSGAGGWVGRYVTVGSGGTLVCGAENSLNSGTHIVDVESGGTLVVSNGVTVKVASMTFGGVTLPQNSTFTVAEVNELIAGSGATLTGGGMIQTGAKSIPGEWTGWPKVGTATKAVVPDGVVAEVLDADLPKLAALAEVECGVGAKIVFKTTADFIDLTAKFSGGVEILVFTDGARVVLDADNSGIVSPGAFIFSNTTVVVSNRYGLGSTAASPATFWPAVPFNSDSNKSYLYFDGPDAVTNDCELLFHYGCQMGHLDPAVRFVQANNVVQKYGSTATFGRFGIRNDMTIAVGSTIDIGSAGTANAGGSTLRIEDGATVKAAGNYGSGTYRIAGDYVGNINIEQCMISFVFERTNTISRANYLNYIDASYGTFLLDLNGYDQTVPCVYGHAYYNDNQQTLTVTSAVPATLTVTSDNAVNRGVAMRFLGQASYAKYGAHTQTVGCATSTTKGTLAVNAGAVRLERNAKWLGSNVVLNGGALVVAASAATNTFGEASETELSVKPGATLHLESGAYTSTVRRISYDGQGLDRGVYSAANTAWISGDGAIRATRGAPGGFMTILR